MPHLGLPVEIVADTGQRGRLGDAVAGLEGVTLEYEELDAGDFLVGGDTAIEVKSGTDFILAVVEGDLLPTASRLQAQYRQPVLLVEGDYFTPRFHQTPFDVHWAIGYLTGVLGIPILYSPEAEHSAMLVYTLAARIQHESGVEQPLRPGQPETRRETIRFLVEGLPGVGPELARGLLRHFGTARAVFEAGETDLLEVAGMTGKTARRITDVLDSKKGK